MLNTRQTHEFMTPQPHTHPFSFLNQYNTFLVIRMGLDLKTWGFKMQTMRAIYNKTPEVEAA